MGWTNPWVLTGLIGGALLLVAFGVIETKVTDPMFHMSLFKIKAFAAGNAAGLLASIGRGGMQFMLIIWLQGIWLPLHGYSYEDTPLWAGIYLVPLMLGFLVAGPISGILSDKFGARSFATGGLLLVAATFIGLTLIPVNFSYWQFATLIALNGIGSGLFSSPNTSAIMSSVPARQRGAASGMRATFFNSGTSLSIGIFFSLMIAGLASALPKTLTAGLTGQGVSGSVAAQIGNAPPVGSLFAAFLGFNPIQELLGPTGQLSTLTAAQRSTLTGKTFFPNLISQPFHHGLVLAFWAAAIMAVIGAVASLMRGGRYYHEEEVLPSAADGSVAVGEAPIGEDEMSIAAASARANEPLGPVHELVHGGEQVRVDVHEHPKREPQHLRS